MKTFLLLTMRQYSLRKSFQQILPSLTRHLSDAKSAQCYRQRLLLRRWEMHPRHRRTNFLGTSFLHPKDRQGPFGDCWSATKSSKTPPYAQADRNGSNTLMDATELEAILWRAVSVLGKALLARSAAPSDNVYQTTLRTFPSPAASFRSNLQAVTPLIAPARSLG